MSETTEDELKAAEGDTPELVKGVRVAYTKPIVTEVCSAVSTLFNLKLGFNHHRNRFTVETCLFG